MIKITTKADLREKIEHIYAIEVKAREDYEKDMLLFNDTKIVKTLSIIKKDEDKHIEMISEMLKILED